MSSSTLEELYGTDDEIRSLPPEDVPIRILYDSPAAASISSDPVPQENIALVLTANAVSAVGVQVLVGPELVFRYTCEKVLSAFPISVVPLVTRSGMPSDSHLQILQRAHHQAPYFIMFHRHY